VKKGLSKSRILAHRQCPKRLYLATYRKELAEESSTSERAFASGNRIGEIARELERGGRLIGHDMELGVALRETTEVLETEPQQALFEGTFQHDGVLVRADVLKLGSAGRVLTEVKAAASVKDIHLDDCAVQACVIEAAGYPLQRIEVAHVDTHFIYPGEGHYDGLLKHADVTKDVRERMKDVPGWIAACRETLAGSEPQISIGGHCTSPYPYTFFEYCRGPEVQNSFPLTSLFQSGKLPQTLAEEGFTDLCMVPEDRLKKPIHQRQRRTAISGEAELDPAVREVLASYPLPRYYFDFESVHPAVPIWAGTHPYQQVPFQWSCHIETVDGRLLHREFLALPPDAPMRACAESLIKTLTSEGPGAVFVYYQAFEKSRIREFAKMFPDLAPALKVILERVVDLLPITRNHYHHPSMGGSWSIKTVLPAIAPDLDYSQLEHVQDGEGASEAYLEILDPATTEARRTELLEALHRYCALDTLAMVRLVQLFEAPTQNP
jgi:hypothetical protein